MRSAIVSVRQAVVAAVLLISTNVYAAVAGNQSQGEDVVPEGRAGSSSYGEGNFIHFGISNGKNVAETGTIVNAVLIWGKWQRNGDDVGSVNNMEFNSTQAAEFTASGHSNSPSSAEGTFEIHENGEKIADVKFSVPFVGRNYFDLKHTNENYNCNQDGFDSSGSPSIAIVCRKTVITGGLVLVQTDPEENKVPTQSVEGGKLSAPGSHPHMVALTRGLTVRTYVCGGSIIGVKTVLTAAHCIGLVYAFGSLISSLRGIMGTNNWNTSGTVYSFSGNATHEDYVSSLLKNDIGLLFTTTDIVYNDLVSPIYLSYEFVSADVKVRVAGWGRTSINSNDSEALFEINVTVIDRTYCFGEVERMRQEYIQFQNSHSVEPQTHICTFHAAGVGTCIGDSGSALVRLDNGKQVGVVSWGFPCAIGAPDIYVRISAYKDWIQSRIQ